MARIDHAGVIRSGAVGPVIELDAGLVSFTRSQYQRAAAGRCLYYPAEASICACETLSSISAVTSWPPVPSASVARLIF